MGAKIYTCIGGPLHRMLREITGDELVLENPEAQVTLDSTDEERESAKAAGEHVYRVRRVRDPAGDVRNFLIFDGLPDDEVVVRLREISRHGSWTVIDKADGSTGLSWASVKVLPFSPTTGCGLTLHGKDGTVFGQLAFFPVGLGPISQEAQMEVVNSIAVCMGADLSEQKTAADHRGWIGVDFDGTLAEFDIWRGPDHVGRPIQTMVDRVKHWLENDQEVRIFTARANLPDSVVAIENFCLKVFGRRLPVTNQKDYLMVELWDDRAIQVIPNTGRTLSDELEAERNALAGAP